MALLCRFVYNQPIQVLAKKPAIPSSFPDCPLSSLKFTYPSLPSRQQCPIPEVKRTHLRSCSSSWREQSMESPPEGYRKNVGICLINPAKKVFTASRLDIPDSWQMPQGGVDEGEDTKTAAIRELKEETGVTSVEVLAEGEDRSILGFTTENFIQMFSIVQNEKGYSYPPYAPYWLTYDFPPEVREKLRRQWGSDWKGQAQKWFLLKLIGKEDEINLLGDGKEKPEFGQWSWVSPEKVVELAVDFKKPVYREVLNVFAPYLQ